MAAKQDSIEALTTLGRWYSQGLHVEKDEQKALELYKRAAEIGGATELFQLGLGYSYCKSIENHEQEAIKIWRQAAEKGSVGAITSLARCYKWGKYVKKDENEAFKLWVRANELDNKIATDEIGICYYLGSGVEQNYEEAIKWFNKGIEWEGEGFCGSTASADYLGECYLLGHGVEKNIYKAAELWESASCYPKVYFLLHKLSQLYSDGIHLEPNYDKAVQFWFELAFNEESGEPVHCESLYNLACCYLEGKGLKKNKQKALSFFRYTVDAFIRVEGLNDDTCYVVQACKKLEEHGSKGYVNKLIRAARNGNSNAELVLAELGIFIPEPKKKEPKAKETKTDDSYLVAVQQALVPKPITDITIGQKVQHKMFGTGVICEIENEGRRIIVEFDTVGKKSFVNPDAFNDNHLSLLD